MASRKTSAPSPKPPATTVADGDIAAIVNGYHGAPFNVLGPHVISVNDRTAVAIRARPLDAVTCARYDLRRAHAHARGRRALRGCSRTAPNLSPTASSRDPAGAEHELEDPYRFPALLTDYDLYLFGEGNLFIATRSWALFRDNRRVRGVTRALAPNAQCVSHRRMNGWDMRPI